MPTTTLHYDYETYSDLDLPKVGADVYARHESTEVLMATYSLCEGPKHDAPFVQWSPVEGEPMPAEFREARLDPSVVKVCWNAGFEMQIDEHVMGLPVRIAEFRDTMILAMSLAFPGKLEKVGDILGLAEEDKKQAARGKALMKIFSSPRKPTKTRPELRTHWFTRGFGERWDEYKAYNRNDVVAERAIWRKLLPYNMSAEEWRAWAMDQEINRLGIPINRTMVDRAVELVEAVTRRRLDEMREMTGLANPNSNIQLLGWLQDNGYPFDDLKVGRITREYEAAKAALARPGSNMDPNYVGVLERRLEVSQVSVKKYAAFQRATAEDGHLRNAFQFYGAPRTGRFAGRLVQLQNLKRPLGEFKKPKAQIMGARHIETIDPDAIELIYAKPMDLLSNCIRGCIQAPPGYVFIDADLNAIENRVLGWMAGDQKIMDVFAQGRDPYVDFSTYMFGGTYDERMHEYKVLGDGTKRQTSKPAVLGCGYMLSAGKEYENEKTGEIEATGLLGYAWGMFIKLTLEEAEKSVKVWRDTFEDVVEYWKTIQAAAKRTIARGIPSEAGPVTFLMEGPFLVMLLPSGRKLRYFQPKIESKMMPWGERGVAITYMGVNDRKQWVRMDTHPGKLTENADQAIARDLLVHGMRLARKEGLRTRIHVHDQLLPMVKEDEADDALKLLIQCMETRPAWARDLPLGSNGFMSPVFIKD